MRSEQPVKTIMLTLFAAEMKPVVNAGTTTPCDLNNVKKNDGDKLEDGGLSSDQLVPDSAARPVTVRQIPFDPLPLQFHL